MLIDFVSGSDPYSWKGYMLAVAFFLVNITKAICSNMYTKCSCRVALRSRAMLVAAVYKKVGLVKIDVV